ncbi:MAG: amidohydrolase [Gemmatimonadales bacterium]|nr:amidohydrolase [Gemmatimonadales bacterium]MDG2241644.1 amidohydrolase [Longimicrobiales bacterium]NCG34253.1 amidohydrolase family protein [Pseudomonadota bacterium]MBT3498654.1 amidohydrolase [Gemmatimonadales bacterium]MBT3775460.1 amidohydrolase [Gemmatimonadales bacterium]
MSEISRKNFLGLGSLAAAGLATGCSAGAASAGVAADQIVVNGLVLTQDDAMPNATAFAVKGGRFIAVGSDADIRNLAAAGTEVVDAGGATVVPGFIDAHSHPSGAGLNALKNVNTNLGSVARIQEALRERAGQTPPGEWIVGYMYDDTKQEEGRPVNRLDLDAVSTDHPIVVGHRGGHTGVYNSKAFEVAGVTVNTPDPFGGHFYRENGELTGKVAERARRAFSVPSGSTREDRSAAVSLICQEMNSTGLTSVHQAGTGQEDFRAYQDAKEAGGLSLRMYLMARGGAYPALRDAGVRTGFGDDMIRVGPVKFAADGSASERTMAMSTPYTGRPDDFGILTMTQEEIHEAVEDAHRNGWQIAIHANGDVTIDMVLNAYERMQREYPREDTRHRLEHCSLVNPEILQRIAAGGFIPAPFYTYAHYHGEKWIEYGAEKMEWMFAHKSFLDHGIMVAPASDHSPGPYEPLMAIQSMVTRKDFSGREWGPSQKITVDQAMRICTRHGAYAAFEEHEKGSITAGKLADYVFLAEDPHETDPDRIKEIKVLRTVVGGRAVYEA